MKSILIRAKGFVLGPSGGKYVSAEAESPRIFEAQLELNSQLALDAIDCLAFPGENVRLFGAIMVEYYVGERGLILEHYSRLQRHTGR